jgi:hypothetical protein
MVNGESITLMKTVIRSLGASAARGGILAQRTWLGMVEQQEAARRQARMPVFTSWARVKDEGEQIIRQAIADGQAEPLILPHPDDIVLDRDNLTVRFVGPTTEEGLRFYEGLRDTRDLFFELMIYTDTQLVNYGDPADHCIGILGVMWMSYHFDLPVRLRGMEPCLERLKANMIRGRYHWAAELRQRCEARTFNFDVFSNPKLMRTIPISKLGMKFRNGLPVPATAKTRRELQRLVKSRSEGRDDSAF